jgi:hypothetical protein
MTETVQQFISRGGQIKKVKRGASAFDYLAPATIKQKIHAQTVQVGRLRKRKKAVKP